MDALLNAVAFFTTLIAMEGVAWATHRYVMHGPLWVLHRSHHEIRHGAFELNDLFAVFFAAIAIGLFLLGMVPGWGIAFWVGAGMTAYGALYALVHDGLVHRRWPMPAPRRSGGYADRLIQAHRLHHAVSTKEGAVSFGFLLPGRPTVLREELRRLRGERAQERA